MSRYWSEVVHGLTPYVPGEQPKLSNLVKLNTNENPYGPSPKVLEALRAAVGESLRLYPDPNSDRLKAAIANFHGLRSQQVFVGNGSDGCWHMYSRPCLSIGHPCCSRTSVTVSIRFTAGCMA